MEKYIDVRKGFRRGLGGRGGTNDCTESLMRDSRLNLWPSYGLIMEGILFRFNSYVVHAICSGAAKCSLRGKGKQRNTTIIDNQEAGTTHSKSGFIDVKITLGQSFVN